MQNIVISTWITCLYGSQPSSVVFPCKTATLGPDLQVCMGPRPHLWFSAHITSCLALDYTGSSPHLWFCACKTAWLAPQLLVSMGSSPHLLFCAFKTATLWQQLHVSMGPRPHLWFSAYKTACLSSELLVSMGSSPHLWFLDAKQRLFDQNNKSLWVPYITCPFVHSKQRE